MYLMSGYRRLILESVFTSIKNMTKICWLWYSVYYVLIFTMMYDIKLFVLVVAFVCSIRFAIYYLLSVSLLLCFSIQRMSFTWFEYTQTYRLFFFLGIGIFVVWLLSVNWTRLKTFVAIVSMIIRVHVIQILNGLYLGEKGLQTLLGVLDLELGSPLVLIFHGLWLCVRGLVPIFFADEKDEVLKETGHYVYKSNIDTVPVCRLQSQQKIEVFYDEEKAIVGRVHSTDGKSGSAMYNGSVGHLFIHCENYLFIFTSGNVWKVMYPRAAILNLTKTWESGISSDNIDKKIQAVSYGYPHESSVFQSLIKYKNSGGLVLGPASYMNEVLLRCELMDNKLSKIYEMLQGKQQDPYFHHKFHSIVSKYDWRTLSWLHDLKPMEMNLFGHLWTKERVVPRKELLEEMLKSYDYEDVAHLKEMRFNSNKYADRLSKSSDFKIDDSIRDKIFLSNFNRDLEKGADRVIIGLNNLGKLEKEIASMTKYQKYAQNTPGHAVSNLLSSAKQLK